MLDIHDNKDQSTQLSNAKTQKMVKQSKWPATVPLNLWTLVRNQAYTVERKLKLNLCCGKQSESRFILSSYSTSTQHSKTTKMPHLIQGSTWLQNMNSSLILQLTWRRHRTSLAARKANTNLQNLICTRLHVAKLPINNLPFELKICLLAPPIKRKELGILNILLRWPNNHYWK